MGNIIFFEYFYMEYELVFLIANMDEIYFLKNS